MTDSRRGRTFFAALILVSLAAACSRDEPPKPQAPADARRVDGSIAGTVRGRVTVDGALPPNPPIKLEGDPACQREHPGGATFENFIGENGGLGNVFVYVKDGLGNYYFDAP